MNIKERDPLRSKTPPPASFTQLPLSKIKPNPLNPRKIFDPADLDELASSFKEFGVIQPIAVYPKNSHFVIICGERRWRAAHKAKLEKIPAVIHSIKPTDDKTISMALIENMHRKDVDVLSESTSIRSLVDEFEWSQADIADKLGVSTSYVRNRYLLTKHADVLEAFRKKELTFSEAAELAMIDESDVRQAVVEKVKNKDFDDHGQLIAYVARYRLVKKAVEQGVFRERPLCRSQVQFDVPGFSTCSTQCTSYLRLTWEEKVRYKVDTKTPGWSEYCSSAEGLCYEKKRKARERFLDHLKKIRVRRPIPEEGLGSMLWYKFRKITCRACSKMIDSHEFEGIGIKVEKNIFAYCIAKNGSCYNSRTQAYRKAEQQRTAHLDRQEKNAKNSIVKHVIAQSVGSNKKDITRLTKRECAYLILQYVCSIGGQDRLLAFAHKNKIAGNLPSSITGQLSAIRNQLLLKYPEEKLVELLFQEAATSVAYSSHKMQPHYFDRMSQKEVSLVFKS